MFWASTQLEEGRLPRFRVVFSPPQNEHLGLAFDFMSIKEWNSEEIRKLAPAVVPPDGVMCVYPDFLLKDKLYIKGLAISDFTALKFEIIEPARMIISSSLSGIVEINGKRLSFIDTNWNNKGLNLMSTFESEEGNQNIRFMLSLFIRSNDSRDIEQNKIAKAWRNNDICS